MERGGRVLQAFGHRLEEKLRRSDLPARWGGEEFSILLPDTTLDEAAEIMNRLRALLHADPIGLSRDKAVTFSCGLAIVRAYGSLAGGMRKADAALYEAKHGGRDRVTCLS